MIAELGIETRLREGVVQGMASLRRNGKTLVSVTERIPSLDPLDLFRAGRASRQFFWQPPDGPSLLAAGTVWSVDRAHAATAWRELLNHAVVTGAEERNTGPLLTACLAFDASRVAGTSWRDFPLNRLTLPRFLVTAGTDDSWLTVNLVLEAVDVVDAVVANLGTQIARFLAPNRAPVVKAASGIIATNAEHFLHVAQQATAAIEQGSLEKVVLARAVELSGTWSSTAVLRHLRETQSHCTTFALGSGDTCFLGATPERLVRLRDGVADVSCLAGTALRGRTEEEDQRLGEELMASAKNRHEHALVLKTICHDLLPVCSDLVVPDEPSLMRLPSVQHLFTPVTAVVPHENVLALVERLHPTPAMAGLPRPEALAFLREREGLDRGGYAGPIGWLDRRGEGDFVVAIRSALLHRQSALTFAGCGIVADSEPDRELEESWWKLRPMLEALGAPDVP